MTSKNDNDVVFHSELCTSSKESSYGKTFMFDVTYLIAGGLIFCSNTKIGTI